MGYLICSKCKGYYELGSGESPKDFEDECSCGDKIRYVEKLDIVDPQWKQINLRKKIKGKEKIRKKMNTIFSFRNRDIKNRFNFLHLKNWLNRSRQRRINRNPTGMDMGLINSLISELNFHNIRWFLLIPFIIAITFILAFLPGIYTLLTFLLLVSLGYLFDNPIIGTKNTAVAGAVSFFLGSLINGSFLFLIPYTFLGIFNGAVCGWIGGYLRSKV